MRLAQTAINAPASLPVVRTLETIQASFSTPASPAEAVIIGTGVTAPGMTRRGRVQRAGVVTSAALIMVAVFSVFATMPVVDLRFLGVGRAAAVLVGAAVAGGVLLPAVFSLPGRRALASVVACRGGAAVHAGEAGSAAAAWAPAGMAPGRSSSPGRVRPGCWDWPGLREGAEGGEAAVQRPVSVASTGGPILVSGKTTQSLREEADR
jgi:hypothetical protein